MPNKSISAIPNRLFSPIFLYHSTFADVPDALGSAVHNVTPDNLYKQVKWLKANYDIVPVDGLFDEPFTAGRCAITFDDAYLSVFEEGVPVLESLNAPATVFVNTTTLDGQIFWRDKIRILISHNLVKDFVRGQAAEFCTAHNITAENFYKATKNPAVNSAALLTYIDAFFAQAPEAAKSAVNYCAGKVEDLCDSPLITFGNHTRSHFVLSSLTKAQQENELVQNAEALRNIIPQERWSNIFSIPFGGVDTFNGETVEILKKQGYKGALLSRDRINPAYKKVLPRIHDLPMAERVMPVNDWRAFQKQMIRLRARCLLGK